MSVTDYMCREIQVLTAVEAIRKRPAMYIGELGPNTPNRLLEEALCHGLAEGCEGRATEMLVTVGVNGMFEVMDNGPGWPVEARGVSGRSMAEGMMTDLFGCKKAKTEENSHLCQTGIVAVNALSEGGMLTTWTNGFEWVQEYEQGRPMGPIRRTGIVTKSGVHLQFQLDRKLFPNPTLEIAPLIAYLRENKADTLSITVFDQRTGITRLLPTDV